MKEHAIARFSGNRGITAADSQLASATAAIGGDVSVNSLKMETENELHDQ